MILFFILNHKISLLSLICIFYIAYIIISQNISSIDEKGLKDIRNWILVFVFFCTIK